MSNSSSRTLGDLSLDRLTLKFECLKCGRRTAALPFRVPGWPERTLGELERILACSACGARIVEIREVIWCQEIDRRESAE